MTREVENMPREEIVARMKSLSPDQRRDGDKLATALELKRKRADCSALRYHVRRLGSEAGASSQVAHAEQTETEEAECGAAVWH